MAALGIKTGLVFFDDCWQHAGLDLNNTCQPTDGAHNNCWMAFPQDVDRTDVDRFEGYVKGVAEAFGNDPRVIWFEVFNEPQVDNDFNVSLRQAGYDWLHELAPMQPIAACWDESSATDLVDHHQYSLPWGGADNDVFMNETGRMQGGWVGGLWVVG